MWILFRTGAKPCFTHAGSEGQLHLNPLSSISVCSLPFYMNSSLLHKQQQALKQTYRCQCLSALGSQNHKSFSSAVTTPPGNIRIPESLPRLSTHLGTPEFLSQFHACPHICPFLSLQQWLEFSLHNQLIFASFNYSILIFVI